jgi:hypothetical protein
MLSIGGYDPTAHNETAVVDPSPYGLGIFDMTALQWTDQYDAAAMPYVQSDQVKMYYSKGFRYPSSWDDSFLEAIFTNSTNASTITPKIRAQINQAAHRNSAGRIVGGVLGGLAGLAVFLFAAWLCYKRRYKRKTVPRPINKQKNYGAAPRPNYLCHKAGAGSDHTSWTPGSFQRRNAGAGSNNTS